VNQIKRIIILLAFLVGILLVATAASSAAAQGDVSFSIRYFDKKVYHISGDADDPIYVLMTVSNNGPSTYRFRLAEERSFSVDFEVRTLKNRPIELSDRLIERRNQRQQIFFREITIEAGESFSFVENIRDYAALREPGSFIVQAKIFPELFRPETAGLNSSGSAPSAVPNLLSNRLSLNLRPPEMRGPDGIPIIMDDETNMPLVREKFSPDKVVEYFLTARQNNEWEKFFLYLDLEALYIREGSRRRQWQRESAEARQAILERFRREIQSGSTERDFSYVPVQFTIEKTEYDAREAQVSVTEQFKPGDYYERMRYTYKLRRKDEYWAIVDYTVSNFVTR
jgi:hypothetical protein